MGIKIISKNKRAYFDYEIFDKYDAGIELRGAEVKSIKNGQVNISDAYVKIIGREAFLWNADIPRYKYSSDETYEPFRQRKLLLKRDELEQIKRKSDGDRMSILPLMIYLSRGLVKVEIALGKGKRSYDKKLRVKERDLDRELHRDKRALMVK